MDRVPYQFEPRNINTRVITHAATAVADSMVKNQKRRFPSNENRVRRRAGADTVAVDAERRAATDRAPTPLERAPLRRKGEIQGAIV
jgi:hypothetical protein